MRWQLASAGQKKVTAARLSRKLAASRDRALEHFEQEYIRVLVGILQEEARDVASRFEATAVPHSLVASAPGPQSTMVAVYPTAEQAGELAQPNGEPAEIIHCTLAFLGDTDSDQAEHALAVVGSVAADQGPLEGTVGGIASFGSETGALAEIGRVASLVAPEGGYGDTAFNSATRAVLWVPADWTTTEEAEAASEALSAIRGVSSVEVAESESALPEGDDWTPVYRAGQALVTAAYPSIVLPDVPGLVELRQAVCEALTAAGIEYSQLHGFNPHLTLAYTETPTLPPKDLLGMPLTFGSLSLARADLARDFPLGDSILAAGTPPDWSPPHPDEVFDPAEFIRRMHTKSDPIRRALIEAAIAEGLDLAGIDFDITNPLVASVLTQTGAKVTEVTDTTKAGIMRVIAQAYEEGLSIIETARALQQAMDDAATSRAQLIARTEMVGLVNGGGVSAMQIVADATGDTYYKRWLTADGAPNPRHEDYDGLDGQTVALDDLFDVGGYQLAYPGDPDGPIEETANCRCVLEYVAAADLESGQGGNLPDPEG